MVKIHAVILIVCFLVLVAVLAFPSLPTLLLAALLLTLLYSFDGMKCPQGGDNLRSALAMLKRMRWFLLSILIVYSWFTPGDPIIQWTVLTAWLPTHEGLLGGMQRVFALAMVIASVSLLLHSLSRAELLGAIWLLARPLQIIGVKPETIALRMTLVIDAMSEVQTLMSHHLPEKRKVPRKLDMVGKLSAGLLNAVIARAQQAAQREVVLPQVGWPPLLQWSLPLLLWGCFYLVKVLWPT